MHPCHPEAKRPKDLDSSLLSVAQNDGTPLPLKSFNPLTLNSKGVITMSTSTSKILICDDEEGIRESLKLILGDFYELIVTDDPTQAVTLLEKAKDVKIVMMDIKMPKVSGLDVLKEIKTRRPDVKVIMVTGYRSVETATEASNLGADGYVVKPFRSEEILETIKKHIKP